MTIFDRGFHPEHVEVEWLQGKRIVSMLGIGKPGSVMRQLRSAGAEIVQAIPVRDHQRYRYDSLDGVDVAMGLNDRATALPQELTGGQGCDALVVTQKDWVKLEKVIDWKRFSLPIVVPRLALEFLEGEDAVRKLVLACAGKETNPQPTDAPKF